MERTELVIGTCLIAIGIGPVSWVILAGNMPPPTCYPPAGYLESCGGTGSRVEAQFTYFWFLVSFFFVGIGGWFVVSGLKSIPIVSKQKV
jgi:hypothetical protein